MVLANTKQLMQSLHTNANAWQAMHSQGPQGQACLKVGLIAHLAFHIESFAREEISRVGEVEYRQVIQSCGQSNWLMLLGVLKAVVMAQVVLGLRGKRYRIGWLFKQHSPVCALFGDCNGGRLRCAAAQWIDVSLLRALLESFAIPIREYGGLSPLSTGAVDIVTPSNGEKVIALQALMLLDGQRKYGIPVA